MSKPVTVTDHAVLRFLERIKCFDVAAIRKEIADIVGPAIALGAPTYSLNGVTFVLKGGSVVTIAEGRSPSTFRREGARKKYGYNSRTPR